jgi:signal transduction histidine kinase
MSRAERRSVEEEIRIEAEGLRSRVDEEVRLFLEVLDSMRELHTISDRITADDFDEFVRKGMLHQKRVLGGFGFAQRIPHAIRETVEGSRGAAGFLERNEDAGYRRAANRDEYFLLTYQAPPDSLGVPLGFDFSSDDAVRNAIRRMSRAGGFALGAPAAGATPGRFVFAPIFHATADALPYPPPGYLYGFAAAVIRPAEIMLRAAAGPSSRKIAAVLADPALESRRAGGAGPGPAAYEAAIPVGDGTWQLRCDVRPEFLRRARTRRPEGLLALGLALTALLTGQIVLLARGTRRIERLVQARTAALRGAKEQLEQEIAERARLEYEIQEIGRRERQQVGRDLHDSLGQKLTGALFLCRSLLTRSGDDAGTGRSPVGQIADVLRESVSQIRRIARGLAPVDLGEGGLPDALRALADETTRMYGIACEFHAEEPLPPIGSHAATQGYHIAQEALTNAARHSGASRIDISLAHDGSEWRLAVRDNGRGIREAEGRNNGMGLRIARHRAGMIGGSLEVRSPDGGGTEVLFRLRPAPGAGPKPDEED